MPMPTEFTPIASGLGGVLIGVSAVLLMLFHGRIAGISNILGRLLPPRTGGDPAHAAAFLAGLIAAPLVYAAAGAASMASAGSRLSPGSFAATATFMAMGFAAVFSSAM
jgi:hypothetical protein